MYVRLSDDLDSDSFYLHNLYPNSNKESDHEK